MQESREGHDGGAASWESRLEFCGSLSLDPLVVPVQTLSATTRLNDNDMAYNVMTVGPVNDKACNRWES